MYLCTRMYVRMCLYACIYVCMHVCLSPSLSLYIYVCMYVCIFIIQRFRTIVFIFMVIFTTFRPICPPAFFRCLSNFFIDYHLWVHAFPNYVLNFNVEFMKSMKTKTNVIKIPSPNLAPEFNSIRCQNL